MMEEKKREELLVRLDERTELMWNRMQQYEKLYITRTEFWPVKSIVYGGAAVVMLGVMTAVVGLVVLK